MNSMKRQKDMTPKDGLSGLVNGKEQKNTSSRNKEAEPKQKQSLIVNVSGGERKVQCSEEQYYIGTWNVRSMNQGKLEVVK